MVCSNCGTPLTEGETHCPGCGALLVSPEEAERINKQNALNNTPKDSQDSEFIDYENIDLPLISNDDVEQNGAKIAKFEEGYEDDLETLNVDEFTAAPSLNVMDEVKDLSQSVDFSNASDVSAYEEFQPVKVDFGDMLHEETGMGSAISASQDEIKIIIPAATEATENVTVSNDKSAPIIMDEQVTVGTVESKKFYTLKIKDKEIRLNQNTTKFALEKGGLFLISLIVGFLVIYLIFPTKNIRYVSNTTTTKKNSETVEVKQGLVKYEISEDYIYDRYMGGLYIYDKDNTWRIYIRPIEGDFSKIYQARKSVYYTLEYADRGKNGINSLQERYIGVYSDDNYRDGVNKALVFSITPNRSIDSSTTIEITGFDYNSKNNKKYVFFLELLSNDGDISDDLYKISDDIITSASFRTDDVVIDSAEDSENVIDIYSYIVSAIKT